MSADVVELGPEEFRLLTTHMLASDGFACDACGPEVAFPCDVVWAAWRVVACAVGTVTPPPDPPDAAAMTGLWADIAAAESRKDLTLAARLRGRALARSTHLPDQTGTG